MSLDATSGPREVMVTRAAFPTTFSPGPLIVIPEWLRRVAGLGGDLIAAVGIVICIPLAVLAIGIPIALCVRLLLWILGGL